MNGGSVPSRRPAATSSAATRVAVLLVIGPVAVAVLEVDAEVLDRLARQLVDDARVDAVGERRDRGRSPRRARRGVGRVLVERPQRHRAELPRRVGLEQVRAAVDRVHRLALRGVARKLLRDADVAFVERVEKRAQGVFRNRRVSHAPAG